MENVIDVYLDDDIIENRENAESIENLNDVESTNTVIEVSEDNTSFATLDTIHEDLGFICTFLVIASVLIFIRIIYKLFNMFF